MANQILETANQELKWLTRNLKLLFCRCKFQSRPSPPGAPESQGGGGRLHQGFRHTEGGGGVQDQGGRCQWRMDSVTPLQQF